ncbi:MAG TPA: DUF4131 domain-containing protein, partial [Allosphingosinicella sp.]
MATGNASAPSIAHPQRGRAWVGRGFGSIAAFGRRLESLADKERDQLPLWLPVGLIVGIAAWFLLPGEASWIAFLLIAFAAMLGLLAAAPGTRWARALAIFALAAAVGCLNIWWKAERVAAPRLERAQLATFSGRIETVQRLPAREAVRLVIATEGAALPPRVRVTVDDEDATDALQPGARI